MNDLFKERAKKALAVTIVIPTEEEEDDEKEDQAVDRPPKLDKDKEEKEFKDAIMNGSENDMKRRKGLKPRDLTERVRMSMSEKD